jgi:L-threonylcarbamoyladenylate synthase
MHLPSNIETRNLSAPAGVSEAARVLAAGGLVAFPTETVYGLGADATSGEAVARIYAAKGRPSFNPLIAHVTDLAAAEREGIFNADARALAQAFWPGPLTLVVPVAATCSISTLARAGLDSIGLRVPAHPIALALLEAFGKPVAAPSANRSGRVSPTRADHVAADLAGRIAAILDGGATDVGVESTIVACLPDGPRLLRPGGVTREAVEAVLGRALPLEEGAGAVIAPGMLQSHYAPHCAVTLEATNGTPDAAILDFQGQLADEPCMARLDLSERGDLMEAATRLFEALRVLDASGATRILVASVPMSGLGEAINDRLARAAAPRDL